MMVALLCRSRLGDYCSTPAFRQARTTARLRGCPRRLAVLSPFSIPFGFRFSWREAERFQFPVKEWSQNILPFRADVNSLFFPVMLRFVSFRPDKPKRRLSGA